MLKNPRNQRSILGASCASNRDRELYFHPRKKVKIMTRHYSVWLALRRT